MTNLFKVGTRVRDQYTGKVGTVLKLHPGWPRVQAVEVEWTTAAWVSQNWEFTLSELEIIDLPPVPAPRQPLKVD